MSAINITPAQVASIVNSLEFDFVSIDPTTIATIIDYFMEVGTKKNMLKVSDMKIFAGPIDPVTNQRVAIPSTFSEALGMGCKFFSIITFISLGGFDRTPGGKWEAMLDDFPPAGHVAPVDEAELAHVLGVVAFFALTRANIPSAPCPAFLEKILKLRYPVDDYAGLLVDGPAGNLPLEWIRYLDYSNVGREMLSRFGLGVAGTRLLGPFRLYKCRDDASDQAKIAYEVAYGLYELAHSWTFHPVTRDPNVIRTFGSLNENLGNLLLECFTTSELDEMKAQKIIYDIPVRKARATNWKSWDDRLLTMSVDPIRLG